MAGNYLIARKRVRTRISVCASFLIAAWILSGCAKSNVKPVVAKQAPSSSPAIKMDGGEGLADLAGAVKTPEDALILDLLTSYRMLVLKNPDPKTLDKATLKKGRQAFEKLEDALRHGGIKSQDGGERVYKVVDEEKLSLKEILHTASRIAEKSAQDGDWQKARARWKEIVQSKASVAFMMDEAQWGLVLGDALQSALPDSTKKRLKQVNESYQAEINHEDIAKQVKRLLDEVPEVKLQRELKKLANRSWEKDKLAGHLTASQQAQTVPPETTTPTGETSKVLPGVASNPAGTASGSPGAATLSSEEAAKAASQTETGERFCEEKRTLAAGSFKDFKKATSDSVKAILLQRTAAYLDSCLFNYPSLPVSQKVRKNREMVEAELKKLKR